MSKPFKQEVRDWLDRNGIDYVDGKMTKKSNTEANFMVNTTKMPKHIDDTDNMAWGDYTFKITSGNMMNLSTLCKYAQMLDFVTRAEGENQLNIDGVINEILNDALSKRVKALAKKHGFESDYDFSETLSACKDGEEVAHVIQESEREAYVRAHDEILAHIPYEDRQMKLFGNTNG